jgi:hypothetical protein
MMQLISVQGNTPLGRTKAVSADAYQDWNTTFVPRGTGYRTAHHGQTLFGNQSHVRTKTIAIQELIATSMVIGFKIVITCHGMRAGQQAMSKEWDIQDGVGDDCSRSRQLRQLSWRASHTISVVPLAVASCLLRLAMGAIARSSRRRSHLAHDVPLTVLYAAIMSCKAQHNSRTTI